MKKPRKKHCPQRRALRLLHHELRHLGAVFITGATELVQPVDLRTGRVVPLTLPLARAIEYTTFNWGVHIYALGIDWQGKRYIKGEECEFTARYRQSDLVGFLNERHQTFLKKAMSKDDLVAAAWIAVPVSKIEVTQELAYKVFEELGAWDR